MKKLNFLQRIFFKQKDIQAYKDYLFAQKVINSKQYKIREQQRTQLDKVFIKHSGNIGDIIYSLPAALSLANGSKINFLFKINEPGNYGKWHHPLGGFMLTDKMVEMLSPLLQYQNFCGQITLFNNQDIDFDFDLIRHSGFEPVQGSIVRWYFWVFGINYNTSMPWLKAPINNDFDNFVVISRSHRYRSPLINYSFLNKYKNLVFIGVQEEFDDMVKVLPNIKWIKVENFLEMAVIINSCKLFIGNQSFPFALAEALKVKRVLEVYYKCPNVVVEGENGYDFMFQNQFEKIISNILN